MPGFQVIRPVQAKLLYNLIDAHVAHCAHCEAQVELVSQEHIVAISHLC